MPDSDFIRTQAEAWTSIWHRFGYNGPGSTLENTAPTREWLQHIIKQYKITSMLDAPCGDWLWLRHVDLGEIRYTGYDIQPEIIARNQETWPQHTFKQINLITTPRLPQVDLIWCRDLLIHLPNDIVARILNKFIKAGRYLAVTNHPGADNFVELPPEGHDGRPGYWCRGIDLEAPPFSLTGRIDSVTEASDGTSGKVGQEMALFRLHG